MNLNNKEDNALVLPDLPDIPLNTSIEQARTQQSYEELPDLPNYKDEMKKITVVEVNDDFYDSPIKGMEKSSFSEKEIKIPYKPVQQQKEISREITKEISSEPLTGKNYIKKDNEIFVRIKKFESAMNSFDEIKEKINTMEKDLEKAKKIIVEETKELEEWEKEVTHMKKGLDSIDHNLFSDLEK